MNTSPAIRKVFQGVATRQQMFSMFDRYAGRPNRWEGDVSALYAGEWFEIGEHEHDYMFEILPPLWIRGSMFAMREFLTGSVTSVFFALRVDQAIRQAQHQILEHLAACRQSVQQNERGRARIACLSIKHFSPVDRRVSVEDDSRHGRYLSRRRHSSSDARSLRPSSYGE